MYVRVFHTDARSREKPCLRCGLSLRPHLDERHCPRCGISTFLSLNPNDTLEWSRPQWLRHMALGAWVLAGAQLLGWIAFALALAGWALIVADAPWLAFTGAGGGGVDEVMLYDGGFDETLMDDPAAGPVAAAPSTAPATAPAQAQAIAPWLDEDMFYREPPPSRLLAIAALVGGLSFLGCGLGLALLTRPERRYPDRTRHIRSGAWIAAGAAGVFGIALAQTALMRLGSGWPGHTFGAWAWKLGAEVVLIALAVCQWAWLRRLAQRAGHWTLARVCGYLLFLPVIPLLKLTPFLGLWILYLASGLLEYLPILYLPASAATLIWFGFLFRRSSIEADRYWASETSTPAAASSAPPPVPA